MLKANYSLGSVASKGAIKFSSSILYFRAQKTSSGVLGKKIIFWSSFICALLHTKPQFMVSN